MRRARAVLAAADAPPAPAWPTHESFEAANAMCRERGLIEFTHNEDWNAVFRAAMLADPIHQRAVALARSWGQLGYSRGEYDALYDAVRDAGLLDGKHE